VIVNFARAIENARWNIARGIHQEPRVLFDAVTLGADAGISVNRVADDVMRNGEDYPLRVRALVAMILPSQDEANIQRVGMRMMFHDAWYMQRDFVPLATWGNKVLSGAQAFSFAQATWQPYAPVVLSARDSLLAQVQLRAAASRRATISYSAIGLDSQRQYFKSAGVNLTDQVVNPVSPELLRNDGGEPILITSISAHCAAEGDANNPMGDIRQLNIQLQQLGNGTNQDWLKGPAENPQLCPAGLIGVTSGRAIVHEFPGEGLLWEPGEGITIEFQPLSPAIADTLGIAVVGTLEVM